jgi:ferrous iron transport protein A
MFLSQLKDGQSAIIKDIKTSKKITERLTLLGLTKGIKITMIRKGVFLSPIEIKVRDFYLAMRKSEADKIEINYE